MSRYGYLVCFDCWIYLVLGRYVRGQGDTSAFFHLGDEGDPANSERPELTKTRWKFHADHQHHPIKVLLSGDAALEELGDIAEIGGDRPLKDVSLEAYPDWIPVFTGLSLPQFRTLVDLIPRPWR